MRTRLIAAFGLVGVVLVSALVLFRALTIADLAADAIRDEVTREARLLATVVAADEGAAPTEESLAAYAAPDRLVTLTLPSGRTLRVQGPDREGSGGPAGRAVVDGVAVEVRAAPSAVDEEVARALPSLLALGGVLVLVALAAGFVVADRLARPFVQLAGAARALGRGRLELRLPRTRVLEARVLADSLRASADRLQESLRRERDLALRASHELRTPLTGLRLELDELRHRDDVPADLVEAAERALARIDGLDAAVESVVEEARSHPVVPEAQQPLARLAREVAARWSEALGVGGTGVDVVLEGDGEAAVTPGPVEQLLDELLVDVLACRPRRVRLVLDGGERHLRLSVGLEAPGEPRAVRPGREPLARARAVADTLGGRVSGALADDRGLVVVLPRR